MCHIHFVRSLQYATNLLFNWEQKPCKVEKFCLVQKPGYLGVTKKCFHGGWWDVLFYAGGSGKAFLRSTGFGPRHEGNEEACVGSEKGNTDRNREGKGPEAETRLVCERNP